jgi:hypothetical protein
MPAPAALVRAVQLLPAADRATPLEMAAEAAQAMAEALVSSDPVVIRRASVLAVEAARLCDPFHTGTGSRWSADVRRRLHAQALAVGGEAFARDVAPAVAEHPFTIPRSSRLGGSLPR